MNPHASEPLGLFTLPPLKSLGFDKPLPSSYSSTKAGDLRSSSILTPPNSGERKSSPNLGKHRAGDGTPLLGFATLNRTPYSPLFRNGTPPSSHTGMDSVELEHNDHAYSQNAFRRDEDYQERIQRLRIRADYLDRMKNSLEPMERTFARELSRHESNRTLPNPPSVAEYHLAYMALGELKRSESLDRAFRKAAQSGNAHVTHNSQQLYPNLLPRVSPQAPIPSTTSRVNETTRRKRKATQSISKDSPAMESADDDDYAAETRPRQKKKKTSTKKMSSTETQDHKPTRGAADKPQYSKDINEYRDFAPTFNGITKSEMSNAIEKATEQLKVVNKQRQRVAPGELHHEDLIESERELAGRLGLTCTTFVLVKRQVFTGFVRCHFGLMDEKKNWNKTLAQYVTNTDVVKVSMVFMFYEDLHMFDVIHYKHLTVDDVPEIVLAKDRSRTAS